MASYRPGQDIRSDKPCGRRRAFVVLSAMLMAGSAAAQGLTATLTGHVTDSTGASIPRASVELLADGKTVATAVSDAGGEFSVQARAGEYALKVMSPGFAMFQRTHVALAAGVQSSEPIALITGPQGYGPVVVQEPLLVDVDLPELPSVLSSAQGGVRKEDAVLLGRLVDANGRTLPGATVELRLRAGQTKVMEVESDAAGGFRLVTSPGRYSVVFSSPGFMRESRRVKLGAGVQQAREAVTLPFLFTGIVVEVPMKTKKVRGEKPSS